VGGGHAGGRGARAVHWESVLRVNRRGRGPEKGPRRWGKMELRGVGSSGRAHRCSTTAPNHRSCQPLRSPGPQPHLPPLASSRAEPEPHACSALAPAARLRLLCALPPRPCLRPDPAPHQRLGLLARLRRPASQAARSRAAAGHLPPARLEPPEAAHCWARRSLRSPAVA
jgi:hypothetical protein